MKVLILEDEQPSARQLERMLKTMDATIEVVANLPSVTDAVNFFRRGDQVDLVFMDIHLEDNLAFQIFEDCEVDAPVIFATAYQDYILRAFKSNGIDYLLKPVKQTELEAAVLKYKKIGKHFQRVAKLPWTDDISRLEKKEYKDRFMTTIGNRIHTVSVSEIAYFQVENKVTYLVATDGRHLALSYTLEWIGELVDPKIFFRINRQALVSHASIQSIKIDSQGRISVDLKPKVSENILVSGDRATAFKSWLGK